MKKRYGWIMTAALAAVGAVSLQAPAGAATRELRMLTWTGYADDDWVKEFEKEQNCKLSVVFAGTDDEFWSKIKGSEGADFDIFAVNTAELQRYIDAGLATPHDLDKIPNQKGTLPRLRDLTQVKGVMRDGKVYAIPWAYDSYESNDVALVWGNFGHQQIKQFKDAGHDVGYVIPKEGALAWLDTWVLSSKVKDKDLAEAWVNFVLQKKISQALTERQGFGNTVTELPGDNPNDKLIWLLPVEDYTKRSDLWNEIKATP